MDNENISWIERKVALNRNEKIYLMSNKKLFDRYLQWNGLFNSNEHSIDGTLSADSYRWRISRV